MRVPVGFQPGGGAFADRYAGHLRADVGDELVLIKGQPGVGKTHLAVGLGMKGVERTSRCSTSASATRHPFIRFVIHRLAGCL